MNQLFNLGYDLGSRGYVWMKYPPGLKQVADKTTPYENTSPRM